MCVVKVIGQPIWAASKCPPHQVRSTKPRWPKIDLISPQQLPHIGVRQLGLWLPSDIWPISLLRYALIAPFGEGAQTLAHPEGSNPPGSREKTGGPLPQGGGWSRSPTHTHRRGTRHRIPHAPQHAYGSLARHRRMIPRRRTWNDPRTMPSRDCWHPSSTTSSTHAPPRHYTA